MKIILFKNKPIQDFKEITLNITASDAIYIGTFTPFNNIYFKASAYNTLSSTINIKYWSGRQFEDSYFVLDETNGFKNEGYIEFQIDPDIGWRSVNNTKTITEIAGNPYYNLYWAKITFSNDLDPITLKYFGDMFCTDDDLYKEFFRFSTPDFLDSWGSSKVDWFDQREIATQLIVQELKKQNRIISSSQVINRKTLVGACVQRVASLIFTNTGTNYQEEARQALAEYESRLNSAISFLDADKDGVYTEKDVNNLAWER